MKNKHFPIIALLSLFALVSACSSEEDSANTTSTQSLEEVDASLASSVDSSETTRENVNGFNVALSRDDGKFLCDGQDKLFATIYGEPNETLTFKPEGFGVEPVATDANGEYILNWSCPPEDGDNILNVTVEGDQTPDINTIIVALYSES